MTIGVSQVGDEGDWRPAWSKDMQDEAKKEGIDLKFADAQGKEEEQLKADRQNIDQLVEKQIDRLTQENPFRPPPQGPWGQPGMGRREGRPPGDRQPGDRPNRPPSDADQP